MQCLPVYVLIFHFLLIVSSALCALHMQETQLDRIDCKRLTFTGNNVLKMYHYILHVHIFLIQNCYFVRLFVFYLFSQNCRRVCVFVVAVVAAAVAAASAKRPTGRHCYLRSVADAQINTHTYTHTRQRPIVYRRRMQTMRFAPTIWWENVLFMQTCASVGQTRVRESNGKYPFNDIVIISFECTWCVSTETFLKCNSFSCLIFSGREYSRPLSSHDGKINGLFFVWRWS